jgi:hypothetical protein
MNCRMLIMPWGEPVGVVVEKISPCGAWREQQDWIRVHKKWRKTLG